MSSSYTSNGISSNAINWWKAPKNQTHNEVFAYVAYMENNQSYRGSDNLRHMRLYGNYEILGLDNYSYTRIETSYNVTHRVTLNVIQSMIDTIVSKLAKNKPKPTFLTEGGDFSLQQKAKKLTKFCEGIFHSTDYYSDSMKAMLDSCIFGTGAVKIFKENNEIRSERVFIDELKIDDAESFYGKPRQMHQVKFISKDVLNEMFPEDKSYIEVATDAEETYSTSRGSADKELIKVIESWHLPSGENASDGKRTITIANKTLLEVPYEHDYFPFIIHRWTERPLGFFGQGLSEQLQGIQMEINKILRTIQVSMHLTSIPKVFIEASSKIVTAHLNNKIGGIIRYAGTKPSYESVGAIPPELFSHLDRLYARAYEITGVSQLSAQSQKPAGLDSGKALREFNDIESERFMAVGQRYETTFMDAAKIMIDIAKEIYDETGNYKVKVKGQKFLETIDWSEVDLDNDKYMMDVFPTSALSSTPAGRLQDVQELLEAGFITKEDGLKLLDFPDLDATYNMVNAALEDIERVIEIMMDKGKYQTPEPYQNLQLGITKMQQAYLMYKNQNAPDSRLELLRRWMEDAQGLMIKASQEEQSQAIQAQSPELVAQDLASAGAVGAAQEVAENADLGLQTPGQTSALPTGTGEVV